MNIEKYISISIFTIKGPIPSSGSSLAQVSAVIKLAMNRWLWGGLRVPDMLLGTGVRKLFTGGQEGGGSRVVAKCSERLSVSNSILSSRICAVLRG